MFGGQGITWIKVRLKIRETVGKVTEGVQFFTRGIRLLGSDCNNCGRLFYRAALGMPLPHYSPLHSTAVMVSSALGKHLHLVCRSGWQISRVWCLLLQKRSSVS